MAEPLEDQIRKALWQCANGHMSLDDFRAWFVPLSWNIEESGESAAVELAHRIDGIFGEASSAGWSDDDLREELASRFASRENRYGDSRQISQSNAGSGASNEAVAA